MGRTKIGGNRIQEKSIQTKHLSDDLAIAEEQLSLNYKTHPHDNKAALDIIVNSNPALVKLLDLKDVALTILEVAEARLKGKSLKNTIDAKANKELVEELAKEISLAKGDYESLSEALRFVISNAEDVIKKHAGLISHSSLDKLYQEVRDAKGDNETLKEKLDSISGGEGGGGSVEVSMLTPWNYEVTLEENQTIIDLPNSYTMGKGNLQVFDGPMLLYSGEENDYTEYSPTQIELNYELPADTVLRFIGLNAGRLFEWILYVSSAQDQEEITLLDKYRPQHRELQIYEDGLLLSPQIDYIEANSNTIRFTRPLVANSNIAIFKRRY